MTPQAKSVLQGAAAAAGVLVVSSWPAAAAWFAGRSGSVGDLSETRVLTIGLLWALLLSVLAGRWMVDVLRKAPANPDVGRIDPWAGYVLGLGVYGLGLTALSAITLLLLLTDEDQSLRSREWLVLALWTAGHVIAAWAALRAAAAVLPGSSPPDTGNRDSD